MDKIVKYGLIAFVLFFVISFPASAAAIIDRAINGLESVGNGLSDFVSDTVL